MLRIKKSIFRCSRLLGMALMIVALSNSYVSAQQEGGGGGGTPWPPPGIPPSVDLNAAGMESMLNGGIQGVPNITPFTNIELSRFVPSDDQCSIGIDPAGLIDGILLRDIRCIRLIPPIPGQLPPFFYFGETDDCGIGQLPGIPGLSERDPVGLRLMGDWDGKQATTGCRLLFGPTDACRLEIDPLILDGLRLYDPTAIRFCDPFDPLAAPPLWFGPNDECGFFAQPGLGLGIYDPTAVRVCNPLPGGIPPFLWFGPDDLCGIGIDPGVLGMSLRDDHGLVISNIGSSGKDGVRINMNTGPRDGLVVSNIGSSGKDGVSIDLGDTGECFILAQQGLNLYDPTAIRICEPFGGPTPPLWFGPNDLCGLAADPAIGLQLYDPTAIRFCNPIDPVLPAPPLWFGPDNLCGLVAQPGFGLQLYDIDAVRLCDPFGGPFPPPFWFGPNDECGFVADPQNGLAVYDPVAIRICNPLDPTLPPPFWFGPDDQCGIVIGDGQFTQGMSFRDIHPFEFLNDVFAFNFIPVSSERWKENIATIDSPLDKIQNLRGVSFDWDKEHGGGSAIGLIAEEVAKVIPDAVSYERDGKSVHGVNYDGLVGLLVEGMKEQQKQFETQLKIVETLKAENHELHNKVAEFEKQKDRTSQLEDEVSALRDQLEAIAATLAEKN